MIRYVWLLIIGIVVAGAPTLASGQTSKVVARGARLWTATCNRCHNRRSPTERTDDQWDVIVSHMRTRANLTKAEAQAIAAFLKQVSKSESQKGGRSRAERTPDSTTAAQSERSAVGTQDQIERRWGTFGPAVLGRWALEDFLQTGPSGRQGRSR